MNENYIEEMENEGEALNQSLALNNEKPSIYNEIVGGLSGSKQYYISWRMQ